ncbi:MAG: carboxypeptidase regulatory-like domain-containing protein [Betaproteobacteria bacterium]|nr:carboxypeptidase regulatory-like domain-containing protein [Betaproteobacteria bacterium]
MQITPLQLALIALGSALLGALALVGAFFIYLMYMGSEGTPVTWTTSPAPTTVSSVPPPSQKGKFVGTMGSTYGRFPDDARNKTLEEGPGKLVGRVTANGAPVVGLKIQLALNGAAMSAWAETNAQGIYEIKVPYGIYRVDGYMLNHNNLDEILGGKTDAPRYGASGVETKVSAETPGTAIDLVFVDAISVTAPKGLVGLDDHLVARWDPYPGAASYRINLTERASEGDWQSSRQLFQWSEQPKTSAPEIDLRSTKAQFKPDHVYLLSVRALDAKDREISSSGNRFSTYDFKMKGR